MLKKLKNVPPLTWLAVGMIAIMLFTLVPLYAIAPYTHPSGDDYTYGNYTVHTYEETGSAAKTVAAGVNAAVERWHNWQGTHTAIFLMTMMPSIFGYDLYPLGAVLLLTFFLFSALFLCHTVFHRWLGFSVQWTVLFAIPFLFLSLQFAPSMVEAFYWFNGAWYYTFYFCLAEVWCAALLRIFLSEKQISRIGLFVFSLFLSFFIGGGNYPVALSLTIMAAFAVIYAFYRKKDVKWYVLSLAAMLLASFMLSALAPGNAVRAEMNDSMSASKAVVLSLYRAFKMVYSSLDGLSLVLYIALIPLCFIAAKRIAGRWNFKFSFPLLIMVGSFGIFASMFTPSLYAMSSIGPGRIQNIYHYASVLLILLNMIYLCGWLIRRFSLKITARENIFILFVAAVVMFSSCGYTDVYTTNTVQAFRQIASGEARRFDEEMNARQAVLQDPSVQDVVLEPLQNKPSVVFLWDIKAQPDIWRNEDMAKYYEKNTIVLRYDDGGY